MRLAASGDVPDVAAIERVAFTDPWPARDFKECVALGVPFLVAEERGVVAGYVVGQWVADEGEILNLGVAPGHRRRGVGRALVEAMLARCGERGVTTVYLEVRESNTGARRLYDTLGFREVARRARYYQRPVEDAVILCATLPPDGERGAPGPARIAGGAGKR
ncbi:MAG TPA: ribosomal protein S18-alanine N-acetyltransferase [Gemmatimonadales bacterium]|nr:ribosomal protein S18-alanine N-acetyltransferase [Gemmatimonadales bacterium]